MLKVLKFGGSSMADAKQFAKVRDIVRADDSRRVVVVRVHNGLHLGKLMGVGHRGAAEFQYL